MTKLHRIAILGLAAMIAPAAAQPLVCDQQTLPNVIRSNGDRELLADPLITCTGGTPTGAGQQVPSVTITTVLTTPVTSVVFDPQSSTLETEVLLLVDDPTPPSTNQLVCGFPPCVILGTGTGSGTYNGTAGRPNVFVGQLVGANAVSWTIPFDPPGSSGARTLRIVNLRASGVAVGNGGAIATTTNSSGFPIVTSTVPLASVQDPLSGVEVTDEESIGVALSAFKLNLMESFPTVFKTRTVTGPFPADQNTPGSPPNFETGFRNSAFPATSFGALGTAGLADTGTRVMVRLYGVPEGVTFTVPTTITMGFAGIARLIDTDEFGGGDYSPSSTGDIVPNSELLAIIVYEFIGSAPGGIETLEIPFTVNYVITEAPPVQQLNGEVGLVPVFGESSNIPLFDSGAFFQFQVEAPPPDPLSISTSTLPSGTVGVFYSQTIQATGGEPPYTFSLAMGNNPPPGLFLQPNGELSGTPMQSGTFIFTVVVTDFALESATRTFQVQIQSSLQFTSSNPLPPGTVGNPYSTTITVTGGTSPYRFFFGTNPPPGFSLSMDGVLSGMPTIAGTFQFTIQVLDAVNSSETAGFSISIAPSGAIFQLSSLQLSFLAPQGGAPPAIQSLTIQSLVDQSVEFTVTTDGGSPGMPAPSWIDVALIGNQVPQRITVGANQGNLPVGVYTARILVGVAGNSGQPPLIVIVTLTIVDAPPELSVFPNLLSFARQITAPGLLSRTVELSNTGGGGPIQFSASVLNNSAWVKAITPTSGQAGTGDALPVRVDIDTTGLPLGFQHDVIRFAWSGGVVDLPISVFVSPGGARMQLSRTGVYFRSNAGAMNLQTRRIRILNLDKFSTILWTVTVLQGDEWLSINSLSGSSTLLDPAWITLGVKPAAASLAEGSHYALIRIDAPNTVNAPQYVVGVLDIQAGNTTSGLDFDSAGVVLNAETGSTTTVSHTFRITTGGTAPVMFDAAVSAVNRPDIFSISPGSGTVTSAGATQLTVSANPTGVEQGVYRAEIAVGTAQSVETLAVTFIVGNAVGALPLPAGARAASCVATGLVATQTGLTNNFSVPAGWPTALVVDLRDDCGNQVVNGSVVADFTNGDPPLGLTGDGYSSLYSATWQPVAQVNPMTITIHAQNPSLPAATIPLTGGVTPNAVPTLFTNGTVHNLDPKLGGPLSPGVVAQVYGTNMASVSESTEAVPLTTLHEGTQVLIGPFQAPLYFVSPGQLNIQIPAELTPNLPYPIVVSANGALTVPDVINVVPVVPGIAAFLDGRVIAQHNNDFALVTPENPAKRDEFLILYLVGLGATNPPVASGAPSPGVPPFGIPVTPVSVTLGGQPVEVPFFGLTPFSVGLFQINMKVPADAPLNTPLDLVVTQGGLTANITTLTVAP